MNKTLSVNIGGIVFHIEEQAYDRLNKYLEAIKKHFTTSDGRDEIIQDIEGRIAEMLQERINVGKQVILDVDVDHVINIMGRPEQFSDTPEETETITAAAEVSSRERRSYRRLYRDADDRWISGVCSGFSHYMGIDPLWLRLAFLVSVFIFGTGILIYIILAIVMPKAVTTAEKLEMKGERVNISNIKKSVLDSGTSDRNESGITRFFDAVGQIITGIFKLLGKIIAVVFIIIGILVLIAFALAFLAMIGVAGISIPFFITDLFMSPWQQTLGLTGAFLFVGIPLIMLIYKAIKVLFKIKSESKILNWSALSLWVVGLIISIVVASSIAGEFRNRESQRTDVPLLQPTADTLYLDVMIPREYRDDGYYMNNRRINDPWTVTSDEDTVKIEDVKLDIIRSTNNEFELVQISASRGRERRDAIENARNIIYNIVQQDSLIRLDETFSITKGTKYRAQKLQLLLKVPLGKSVYLSDDMDNIIYDIDNVTNTYDGDMVGKTWTMTENGLACIGCNLPNEHFEHRKDNVRVRIDSKGVKVEGVGKDSDSTFHIDGDDVDINITDGGVEIDARKK